jgi:hypothetical protein
MSCNHLTSISTMSSHRPSLRQQLLRQLGHARINRASPTTAQPRSRANQRAQVSTTPAADKPQSKVEHERLHRTVRALLQTMDRQTDRQTDSNRIDGSGLAWQLWQLATVI